MGDNKLYYTDTDLLILENKLPSNLIGPELEKWKLEGELIQGLCVINYIYKYVYVWIIKR